MIFLTVGHQTPFDRLVQLVDRWAEIHQDEQIVAQIGDGSYLPRNMEWTRWLSPDEFEKRIDACDAVVAHAGTGTIIQVLLRRKPLLVLPRLAALGETRNDHQVATARHFSAQGHLQAASDDADLLRRLDVIREHGCQVEVGREASPELLARLGRFVSEEAGDRSGKSGHLRNWLSILSRRNRTDSRKDLNGSRRVTTPANHKPQP